MTLLDLAPCPLETGTRVRLIMMGTGPFAVPTFESLLRSEHLIAALVTRPVRPAKGRGAVSKSPTQAVAEVAGVEVLAPEDVNDVASRAALARMNAELFVVCDYGQILSRETLSLPRWGGINLHGSLLPKYRGAAPVNWAILSGDRETGVSVIHMTPRLDAGPCLAIARTPIGPDENAVELERRLSLLGVAPVHEAIALLQRWDGHSPIGVVQDRALATRAPRLSKSDGEIRWSQSAQQIANQVRGLQPWPGTYTHWSGTGDASQRMRLIVDRVSIVAASEPGTLAGTVVPSPPGKLVVACGTDWVSIDRVQPAGKRSMEIAEFLRGHNVPPGSQLG